MKICNSRRFVCLSRQLCDAHRISKNYKIVKSERRDMMRCDNPISFDKMSNFLFSQKF